MTDPARQGVSPTAQPAPPDLPDWRRFARSGEWRRAQAAASLGQQPHELVGTLSRLSTLQSDVRARRYPAARRVLEDYRALLDELAQVSQGDAALLRSLAEPDLLTPALAALEAGSGESDPATLQERLSPAHHPLTRAEALNALGILHALRREEAAARARFEEALSHDPGHYRARMNLGNLDLEAGRLPEAEAAYREVIRLAPEYDNAHHNLGVVLRRQGKLYESVGAIRRAQRLGVRGAREQAKAEMEEQLRQNPRLRYIRVGIFAGALLLLVLLAWLNRGGA